MADATGPATSPDNIPTYLTSADPPSGKGFNTAIAAIQTALNARVSKPSGIVSGETPVWNGTTWVRSSSLSSVAVNPAPGVGSLYTPSTTNADLAAPTSWFHSLNPTVNTVTIRSIAPGATGQRLMLRNGNQNCVLLHNTGGGTAGGSLFLRSQTSAPFNNTDVIEFVYDGAEWLEVSRAASGPDLIANFTGASAMFDVSFASGVYKSIKIMGTVHWGTVGGYGVFLRFNNDSGAVYDNHFIGGSTVATNYIDAVGQTQGLIGFGDSNYGPTNLSVDIPSANGTTITGRYWTGHFVSQSASIGTVGHIVAAHGGGLYYGTSPLTRIQILPPSGSFAGQTDIKVYGYR